MCATVIQHIYQCIALPQLIQLSRFTAGSFYLNEKINSEIFFCFFVVAETSQLQAPRFTTQPSSSGSIVNEGRTKIIQCHALGEFFFRLLFITLFLKFASAIKHYITWDLWFLTPFFIVSAVNAARSMSAALANVAGKTKCNVIARTHLKLIRYEKSKKRTKMNHFWLNNK